MSITLQYIHLLQWNGILLKVKVEKVKKLHSKECFFCVTLFVYFMVLFCTICEVQIRCVKKVAIVEQISEPHAASLCCCG